MRNRTPGILVATILALALTAPVAVAASQLSDPRVSPAMGTTADTFEFSVHYEGSAPQSIIARVAGDQLTLMLDSGQSATNGTYSAAVGLPAGTHSVVFAADLPGNGQDTEVALGHEVIVTEEATSAPTVPPTSEPTTAPTAPPRPPTPQPTTRPTLPPLAPTPLPPVIGAISPGASPSGSPDASGAGSPPTASGFVGGVVRSASADASAAAAPGVTPTVQRGDGGGVWTLVGGGMLGIAALTVLAMIGLLRTRRREMPGWEAVPVIGARPDVIWDSDQPELLATAFIDAYPVDDTPTVAVEDEAPARS